jgi:hypothetical protein
MSEPWKIFWTSAATLVGGVALLVISELIKQFIIAPLQALKKVCGEIDYNLRLFAGQLASPKEFSDTAQRTLRELSCRLSASANALNCKCFLVDIRAAPSRPDLTKASNTLILLSNTTDKTDGHDNDKSIKTVRQLLRLPDDTA